MKNYIYYGLFVTLIMAVVNIYVVFKTQRSYDLSKITVESLANESSSGETGEAGALPEGYIVGKVMRTVYIPNGVTVGGSLGAGDNISVSLSYTVDSRAIFCCINKNEHSACNKKSENHDCQNVNLTGVKA